MPDAPGTPALAGRAPPRPPLPGRAAKSRPPRPFRSSGGSATAGPCLTGRRTPPTCVTVALADAGRALPDPDPGRGPAPFAPPCRRCAASSLEAPRAAARYGLSGASAERGPALSPAGGCGSDPKVSGGRLGRRKATPGASDACAEPPICAHSCGRCRTPMLARKAHAVLLLNARRRHASRAARRVTTRGSSRLRRPWPDRFHSGDRHPSGPRGPPSGACRLRAWQKGARRLRPRSASRPRLQASKVQGRGRESAQRTHRAKVPSDQQAARSRHGS